MFAMKIHITQRRLHEGAKVVISHPTRGNTIAEGITDANGLFTVELPEGYYAIYVSADKHDSYRNQILVDPGKENNILINLTNIKKCV